MFMIRKNCAHFFAKGVLEHVECSFDLHVKMFCWKSAELSLKFEKKYTSFPSIDTFYPECVVEYLESSLWKPAVKLQLELQNKFANKHFFSE